MEDLRIMILLMLNILMFLTVGSVLWFLVFILLTIDAIIIYFKDIRE